MHLMQGIKRIVGRGAGDPWWLMKVAESRVAKVKETISWG